MKKNIVTVLTVILVLTLIVFSIILDDITFSQKQFETLKILLIVCGCSIAYCFITGEITHNYSQMDKLWSLLPIAYVWIIAVRGGLGLRLIVYALIVTAWGIRLTINFARKGAYSLKFWEGREDYRWSIVHNAPVFRHGILWTLFNLLFISAYQNLLVLAICLPALSCMGSQEAFGIFDIIAAVLSVLFLILETVSDEYQWNFHQTKNRMLAEGKKLAELPAPFDLGFNTLGPWGRMRHPNYLGEQGMWLGLYIFSIGAGAAGCALLNITAIGPLLLVLLFLASSTLAEKISLGKYPKYAAYIEQVSKYLPVRRFDPEA